MTPERYQRILETLSRRQPDLTVVADEVHKGRNLSAIVRTCDSVGIDTIHTVIPQKGYRGFRGTASGSHKWVEVKTHYNLVAPLEQLKGQGFQIVAADVGQQCVNYRAIDYTKPTALLLGSEKDGLSHTASELCDHKITIPMIGMVESLNVSVATAVILQEIYHQRNDANLYGTNQLSSDLQQRRFFQWAHPKVAEFCDEKGLAYPPVRESDGEIVNASQWYQSVLNSLNPTNRAPM